MNTEDQTDYMYEKALKMVNPSQIYFIQLVDTHEHAALPLARILKMVN